MNVATYHRVPPGSETFSPEDRCAIRLVRQHDWTLVHSYTDAPGAGAREGLARLIADARRGRFAAVVVYRFELLYRSRRELEATLDELELDLVTVVPLPARPRENRGRPPAEFDVARAAELRELGWTFTAIAGELGVGHATVHRALTRTLVRKPPHRLMRSPAPTNSDRVLELPFAAAAAP